MFFTIMVQTTLEPNVREAAHPPAAPEPEAGLAARRAKYFDRHSRFPMYVAIASAAVSIPASLWIGVASQRVSNRLVNQDDHAHRQVSVRASEPIQPIVPFDDLKPKLVRLGQRLFFDERLSADRTVSCASCHDLSKGGTDARRFSIGIDGQSGDINAPTIYNSAFNFRQFWDGRAETLEDQVDGPIQNAKEMGATWEHVLSELERDPTYEGQFREALGSGVSRDNVRRAIAEFERSLTTPNSRFDRWLRGDDAVLAERELAGYQKFKDYQCISCHQGVNLGGSMYQRLGVMAEYFTREREETQSDLGRFNVTGKEYDRHVFRVPPLRNVALTAPYFHDGSAKTLPDAIRVMIHDQLGRDVVDKDVDELAAFLETLTGELPKVEQP